MDFNGEKENMTEFLKRRSSILKTRGDEPKTAQNPTATLTRRISFHNILKVQKYDREKYDIYKEEEEQFHMTSEAFSTSILGELADNTAKVHAMDFDKQKEGVTEKAKHQSFVMKTCDNSAVQNQNRRSATKIQKCDEDHGDLQKKREEEQSHATTEIFSTSYECVPSHNTVTDLTLMNGPQACSTPITFKRGDRTVDVFDDIEVGEFAAMKTCEMAKVMDEGRVIANFKEKESSNMTMSVFDNIGGRRLAKKTDNEFCATETLVYEPEDKNLSTATAEKSDKEAGTYIVSNAAKDVSCTEQGENTRTIIKAAPARFDSLSSEAVLEEESRWSNRFCDNDTNGSQTIAKFADAGSMFADITEKMMAQEAARLENNNNTSNFSESSILPVPTNFLLRSRSRQLNRDTLTVANVNASALREPAEPSTGSSMNWSPTFNNNTVSKHLAVTENTSGDTLTNFPGEPSTYKNVSRPFHQRRRNSLPSSSAVGSPIFVTATDCSFWNTVVKLNDADIETARETLAKKQKLYSLVELLAGRIASMKEQEAQFDAKMKDILSENFF